MKPVIDDRKANQPAMLGVDESNERLPTKDVDKLTLKQLLMAKYPVAELRFPRRKPFKMKPVVFLD